MELVFCKRSDNVFAMKAFIHTVKELKIKQ